MRKIDLIKQLEQYDDYDDIGIVDRDGNIQLIKEIDFDEYDGIRLHYI